MSKESVRGRDSSLSSVWGRLFRALDDEHGNGAALRVQLQPELFLNGRFQRGAVRIRRRRRERRTRRLSPGGRPIRMPCGVHWRSTS